MERLELMYTGVEADVVLLPMCADNNKSKRATRERRGNWHGNN